MKNYFLFILICIAFGCTKSNDSGTSIVNDNYSSMNDFYLRNGIKLESHYFNSDTSGIFRTGNGTDVRIPPHAFIKLNGDSVIGTVKIDFKEVYNKSDMLFADKHTLGTYGNLLKSGGMFYIKASVNDTVLKMNTNKFISVSQLVLANETVDSSMLAFKPLDSLSGVLGWSWDPGDTILHTANGYVYDLYTFSTQADSGTWCNSDDENYFYAFPTTMLTLHQNISPDSFYTDVFLIFKNIRSMVHVYGWGSDFIYYHAPLGFQCTLVAIGVKGGQLYSDFVPITISTNQTVNFSLSPTSTSIFKSKLYSLN